MRHGMEKKTKAFLLWLRYYAVCFAVVFVWRIFSDWLFDGDPWKSCNLGSVVSVGVSVLIVCIVLVWARRYDSE